MNTITQNLYKYRRLAIFSVIILGVFFYTFWSSFATKDFVVIPQLFSDARVKSDSISKEFVSLSQTTQENLQNIKDLDEKGRTDQALTVIREQINKGDKLKSKGAELLGSLSQMTYSLGGIRPDGARAAAYEAITNRIEMINSLVTYSNELDQILKLLTSRVLYGDNISNLLQEKIDAANKNARGINDLNMKYNDAMKKLENF